MQTILVIDDDVANAEMLSLILEDEGYRVLRARTGPDGLARVAKAKPDLVILDFMLPGPDGAQIGQALRDEPLSQHIKILMNSSLPEAAVRSHFSRYDGFLRKPYDIDALVEAIVRLLPH